MNQKDRAEAVVSEIKEQLRPRLYDLNVALTAIVGEAQNVPPEGEADGSIDADEWVRFANISGRLKDLLYLLG